MSDDARDEIVTDYLSEVTRLLGDESDSDASEIVEGLRSHIDDALRERPDMSVSELLGVLRSLGSPAAIAESARTPSRAPRTRSNSRLLVAAIVIGVAALVASGVATAVAVSNAPAVKHHHGWPPQVWDLKGRATNDVRYGSASFSSSAVSATKWQLELRLVAGPYVHWEDFDALPKEPALEIVWLNNDGTIELTNARGMPILRDVQPSKRWVTKTVRG